MEAVGGRGWIGLGLAIKAEVAVASIIWGVVRLFDGSSFTTIRLEIGMGDEVVSPPSLASHAVYAPLTPRPSSASCFSSISSLPKQSPTSSARNFGRWRMTRLIGGGSNVILWRDEGQEGGKRRIVFLEGGEEIGRVRCGSSGHNRLKALYGTRHTW